MAVLDKDVKGIIETKRDTTPFIATATLIVVEAPKMAILSQARKDQIIIYLSAHFVWNAESNGLVMAEINKAREVYRTFSDKSYGLDTSRYGQMAIQLDTTGTLSAMSLSTLPAKFKVFEQRRRHFSFGNW